MAKLSVNINKIALVRNSRGGNKPDVVKAALDIISFGSDGITVHPRPDERHIKKRDVALLKDALSVELNVEGYPSDDFIALIEKIIPSQVTLVPDPPGALTSSFGWDTHEHKYFLREVVSKFKDMGVRTSLFVEPSVRMVEGASECYTDRIELYTEAYAENYTRNREEAIEPYIICSEVAYKLGLGVNAGHDLNLENLKYFVDNLPNLLEVSIGHALVCDALNYGLELTVSRYLRAAKGIS